MFFNINFLVILLLGGLVYAAIRRSFTAPSLDVILLPLVALPDVPAGIIPGAGLLVKTWL